MIFEITVDHIQLGSIAGGGRYDFFSDKLHIPELKCVGFSFGIDRLLVAIDELGIKLIQNTRKRILFANDNDDFDQNIIRSLRKKYTVEIFFDKNVDFKHQLKFANKKNFDKVVFKYDNKYFIKDMSTSVQKELPIEDLNNL
jgi:histidyl-tRNA synthetase